MTSFVKAQLCLICFVLVIDFVLCLENDTSSQLSEEARKRKRPFHYLVKPYGYSVLYGLFALKLKVIVVTITVVGILGIFAHMFVMPFVGRWLFKKNTCEYPEHVYLDHPPPSYTYKEYGADTSYGVPAPYGVSNDRKQTVKDSYLPQRRSKRNSSESSSKRLSQANKQSWIKAVCRQRVRCEQQTKLSLTKESNEKKLINLSSTSSLITARCAFLRKICPDQTLSNIQL